MEPMKYEMKTTNTQMDCFHDILRIEKDKKEGREQEKGGEEVGKDDGEEWIQ